MNLSISTLSQKWHGHDEQFLHAVFYIWHLSTR